MLKAILVGLKKVDPNAYDGWDGTNGCAGCEKDVDNIKKAIDALGYMTETIKTMDATRKNILSSIETASSELKAGDTLVFYFSGHGGQQPDSNGDESDGHDETLIAYDGPIIDDELNEKWLKFQIGVRIFMLSDSCNSGTNYRNLKDINFSQATQWKPLTSKARQSMQAQLIHISGCRDGATSAGYNDGGAFTLALLSIWDQARFTEDYSSFHQQIVNRLSIDGENQVPQYNEYGPVTGAFSCQKPFMAAGWGFLLQTGTCLHETDDTFEFLLAQNRDIFAIKKSNTGTNSTEVHVLSADSNYHKFILQTGTALHETDHNYEFLLTPNRDIIAIKKKNTGSFSTEAHILSAASSYQKFILQTGTALHETDHAFRFLVAPNRDIFAIKKSNTGTNSTEVHVLSADSNYQSFILQTGTALHETDHTFDFSIAPNRDIYAIKKNNTATRSTEVHVLSSEKNYKSWKMQRGTVLHETSDIFSFFVFNGQELLSIKKSQTGTGSTEVHIIDLPPWRI